MIHEVNMQGTSPLKGVIRAIVERLLADNCLDRAMTAGKIPVVQDLDGVISVHFIEHDESPHAIVPLRPGPVIDRIHTLRSSALELSPRGEELYDRSVVLPRATLPGVTSAHPRPELLVAEGSDETRICPIPKSVFDKYPLHHWHNQFVVPLDFHGKTAVGVHTVVLTKVEIKDDLVAEIHKSVRSTCGPMIQKIGSRGSGLSLSGVLRAPRRDGAAGQSLVDLLRGGRALQEYTTAPTSPTVELDHSDIERRRIHASYREMATSTVSAEVSSVGTSTDPVEIPSQCDSILELHGSGLRLYRSAVRRGYAGTPNRWLRGSRTARALPGWCNKASVWKPNDILCWRRVPRSETTTVMPIGLPIDIAQGRVASSRGGGYGSRYPPGGTVDATHLTRPLRAALEKALVWNLAFTRVGRRK